MLEDDAFSCPGDFDTLTVYDHDDDVRLGVYCGGDIPPEFRSTGRSLRLRFKSDTTITEKGFSAAYYFLSSMLIPLVSIHKRVSPELKLSLD